VSPIQVNSEETGKQTSPDFTYLADGTLVVVWESETGDSDGSGIRARHFDAAGSPMGNEFIVNTSEAGPQISPSIVALDDGGYVIGWSSSPGTNPVPNPPQSEFFDSGDVIVQRYDNQGQKIGNELILDILNNGTLTSRKLVLSAVNNNGFIASWRDGSLPNTREDAIFRRYDGSGAAVFSPVIFQTAVNFDFVRTEKIVEASNGRIAVAYTVNIDTYGFFANFKLYDSTGALISSNNFGGIPFPNKPESFVQDVIALGNDNFALVTAVEAFASTSTPASTSLHIIDNDGVILSTQTLSEGEVEYVLTPLPDGGFLASSFDGSTSTSLHFDNMGNQVGSSISLSVEGPSQFNGNGGAASVSVNTDSDEDGIILNLYSAN